MIAISTWPCTSSLPTGLPTISTRMLRGTNSSSTRTRKTGRRCEFSMRRLTSSLSIENEAGLGGKNGRRPAARFAITSAHSWMPLARTFPGGATTVPGVISRTRASAGGGAALLLHPNDGFLPTVFLEWHFSRLHNRTIFVFSLHDLPRRSNLQSRITPLSIDRVKPFYFIKVHNVFEIPADNDIRLGNGCQGNVVSVSP